MSERCPECKQSALVYDWHEGARLRLICRNPACRAIFDPAYKLVARWSLPETKEKGEMCDKKGCDRPGVLHPVFLVRVHENHEPTQAILSLTLCVECAQGTVLDDLMDDNGWESILAGFKKAGRQAPTRELTELAWTTDEPTA